MKSAGKARSNGLYRHIRTSKEIIRNLLNDYINNSYIDELIDLLIEGISDAVARNTENVLQELERSQKER